MTLVLLRTWWFRFHLRRKTPRPKPYILRLSQYQRRHPINNNQWIIDHTKASQFMAFQEDSQVAWHQSCISSSPPHCPRSGSCPYVKSLCGLRRFHVCALVAVYVSVFTSRLKTPRPKPLQIWLLFKVSETKSLGLHCLVKSLGTWITHRTHM
jgi:hypothetical protein